MYYQCCKCDRSFDAETDPSVCPFCKSLYPGFAKISYVTEDGRDLTYAEHIQDLRDYYLEFPPAGMTKEDIAQMDDRDLENLDDIMCEIEGLIDD